MTELNVTVVNIDEYDDEILLKLNDELSFYMPLKEFNQYDLNNDFKKVGSMLTLLIEGKDLKGIKFNIFCYDEKWEKFQKEIKEILSGFKLKN